MGITKKIVVRFWPVLVILFMVMIFTRPWWNKGLIPFPSSYLVTSFVPWQYYYGLPVKNNAMPDVVGQMFPWKHLVIDFWKNGQLPLWNPNNFSGSPLMANYQSAVFHPLNFLFFIFSEINAWSWLIILQPLLAGLFCYLYSREIGLKQISACLSAIAFMFCGFITVWMAYGTLASALLWLPLTLWGIERIFQKKSFLARIVLSLSLAASLFSGHFQTSVYVLLASFFYLVFKGITTRYCAGLVTSVIYLILGILLALVQLLPTYELYSHSVRSQAIGFAVNEAIPLKYLFTLIAPDFYGNPTTRNDWFGHYAEWSSYIGVIPFFLAIYYFFSRKNKQLFVFFVFLAFLGFVLSLSTPLLSLFVQLKLPIFSNSAASRAISLFSFSMAILAGVGLERLAQDLKNRAKKKIIIFTLVLVLIIATIWFWLLIFRPFPTEQLLITKRNFVLPTLLVGSFVGFLLSGIFLFKKEKLIILALVFLSIFDVLRFAIKWMPFESKEYFYPSLPIINYLSSIVAPDRLFGNFGMELQNFYQIPGFQGYDSLFIARYGELVMSVGDGKIRSFSPRDVSLVNRSKYTSNLFNLMGGKYLLYALPDARYSWAFPFWDELERYEKLYKDDKFEVYYNKQAYPRTYLVTDYRVRTDAQKIIDAMFDSKTDLRRTVVLEEEPFLKPSTTKKETELLASIKSYQANKVDIDVSAPVNSLLFLSDNYYPGWQAYIDGQKTKIYRADYTFRAVAVPAGNHEVEFIYQPESFLLGQKISLASLVILVLVFLFRFGLKIKR